VIKDDNNIDKLKRAAVSALSAAAVKAKLLANQEEDQIRELAASLIEKQVFLQPSWLSMLYSIIVHRSVTLRMVPYVAVT
jgi:hypothetical protein